jgi:hypothetical protein
MNLYVLVSYIEHTVNRSDTYVRYKRMMEKPWSASRKLIELWRNSNERSHMYYTYNACTFSLVVNKEWFTCHCFFPRNCVRYFSNKINEHRAQWILRNISVCCDEFCFAFGKSRLWISAPRPVTQLDFLFFVFFFFFFFLQRNVHLVS